MINVIINGKEYPLREFSLNISETLNERATCSLSVKTSLSDTIAKGMPIRITDGDDLLFRGFINSTKHRDYPVQDIRLYEVDCTDMHYLVDKRIYVRGFVDTSCGDIVKTMIDEVLREEGITYTDSSVELGYTITGISFNYKKCNDILDQLAELAQFVWYVDYDGVLHFKNPNTIGQAPTVTDGTITSAGLDIQNKNNAYRNKQYIKGAVAETAEITQVFYGDGANQAFTLGYRLADKPKIYVNGEYILEDDIVLKGYNESAKWYYQKQDAVILQNPDHTPLAKGIELRVVYKGIFPIVAITESQAEVERNKALGAGTGIIEVVDDESDITSLSTAITTAVGRLWKYCGNTYQVTFTTSVKGFDVGQLVDFNTSDLVDSGYLIESVDIVDDMPLVWYKVRAVKGALSESWETVLGRGLRSKPTVANTELSEQETVVLSRSYSKTWSYEESPNIFRKVCPSATTFPNGRLTPTFLEMERVSFMEVIGADGSVLTRNIISTQSDNTRDVIYSYFYIDPFTAVGTWKELKFYGGTGANFTHNSGVLIDTIAVNVTKTQLEGVQIDRTDKKGW